MEKIKAILDVDEVAEYLGVHRSTIYRLLKQKKFPAFKVGSDWRFRKDIIDQWTLNQTQIYNGDK